MRPALNHIAHGGLVKCSLGALMVAFVAVSAPVSGHGELKIKYHTAGEEMLLQGSDGRTILVRGSEGTTAMPAGGRWYSEGDLRDKADWIFWYPDYVVRRELGPDAEFDLEKPIAVQAYLRHGRGLNSEGQMDDGHLVARWSGMINKPAAAVFLWVIDDRVREIEVQPLHVPEDYLNFTLRAKRWFSRLDAARSRVGIAIVLDGQILKPKPVFPAATWKAVLFDDSISLDHASAAGANMRLGSDYRQPLPFVAAQSGSTKVLEKLLMTEPAMVHATNGKGETLLHLAAYYGRTDTAALLLKLGAKADKGSRRELSPMMVATIYGHLEMVRMLASAGAAITEEHDSIPMNLQDAAIESGDLELVSFLARQGARLPPEGRIHTHLIRASAAGHYNVAAWLLKEGGKNIPKAVKSQALLNAAEASTDSRIISLLLSAGADAQEKDQHGNCPMTLACRRGQLSLVRAFLDGGADINAQDAEGNTALHIAADSNDRELTAFLLERGANRQIRNHKMLLPLGVSLLGNSPDSARLLSDDGDKINLDDVQAKALLLAAIRLNLTKLVSAAMSDGWSPATMFSDGWSALQVAEIFEAKDVATALSLASVPEKKIPIARKSALDANPKLIFHQSVIDPRETNNGSPLAIKVRCIIDAKGRVVFPSFLDRPEGRNLAQVLASVSAWRFVPPTSAGKPTAVLVELPVLIRPARPEIARLSEVDEYPQVLRRTSPDYPKIKLLEKDPGGALVFVTVDQEGKVQQARVAVDQSSPFVQAALASVRQWEFRPARQNNIPVSVELEVPFYWNK